ncbi:MAG: hypothetical protein D6713_07155 [Deltaproteobacteria bacterium]|nr:MAG: hypothetical protein D6713_07155 [Deltaproteobacteria bacterium]
MRGWEKNGIFHLAGYGVVDISGPVWVEPIMAPAGFLPRFIQVDENKIVIGGETYSLGPLHLQEGSVSSIASVEKASSWVWKVLGKTPAPPTVAREVELFLRTLSTLISTVGSDELALSYLSLPPPMRLATQPGELLLPGESFRFPRNFSVRDCIYRYEKRLAHPLLRENLPGLLKLGLLLEDARGEK